MPTMTRATTVAFWILSTLACSSSDTGSTNERLSCISMSEPDAGSVADAGPDAAADAGAVDGGNGLPECPTKEEALEQLTDWCQHNPVEVISGPEVGGGQCCYVARWSACTDTEPEEESCATAPGRERVSRSAQWLLLCSLGGLLFARSRVRVKRRATSACSRNSR